ncbi:MULTISPECIES: amino acid permease [Francisella]|uniref:Amino acid transporter n=1 Tax=Francisella adeliensis TaxID=2007306 RepID=A0A2Z4XZE5_9GAMM|nr:MULTISPECIES: aromatic amino acid transport family protein [Francisella]AXA34231.1 amino acid transporter [Francisella adeliensis]MBK2084872.1 GerAB/ArcD/ProY family transporter [Francisella adeliensis]MBK2096297.1 GerAB/ArcD/ProY family transporter [Francisella adeliensis]QIW12475.1 GerAB/ArcD/ProY family transporter [Francisella adeliensis]QIW14348.1 GerAB/ArcD/ProY family transporter [Francisella adeliensis]
MQNTENSFIKVLGCIMIIVGTMIGAGILALPIITAKLGFLLGSFLIIVIWSIMTYTAIIISDISCSMPYGSSFKSIAEKYLGKAGGIVATIAFLLLMYFISTAYISAAASSMSVDFPSISEKYSSILFVLIFGSIVVLGTRFVDYANRFFISLKIIILVILCVVFNRYIESANLLVSPVDLGASLLISIPVFTTSFTSHIIVPALSDYLNKNARDMKKAIIIGSVIPLILYIIWVVTILGVLPLHGPVSFMGSIFDHIPVGKANIDNILTTIGNKIHTPVTDAVLHIFTYVAIMTSFLSVNLSLFHFNMDTYKLHKLKTITGYSIAAILTFAIPLIINQMDPNIFIYAMTCVGLSIAVLLMIMPGLMAFRMNSLGESFNYKISSYKVLWIISILSGIIVLSCVIA